MPILTFGLTIANWGRRRPHPHFSSKGPFRGIHSFMANMYNYVHLFIKYPFLYTSVRLQRSDGRSEMRKGLMLFNHIHAFVRWVMGICKQNKSLRGHMYCQVTEIHLKDLLPCMIRNTSMYSSNVFLKVFPTKGIQWAVHSLTFFPRTQNVNEK